MDGRSTFDRRRSRSSWAARSARLDGETSAVEPRNNLDRKACDKRAPAVLALIERREESEREGKKKKKDTGPEFRLKSRRGLRSQIYCFVLDAFC